MGPLALSLLVCIILVTLLGIEVRRRLHKNVASSVPTVRPLRSYKDFLIRTPRRDRQAAYLADYGEVYQVQLSVSHCIEPLILVLTFPCLSIGQPPGTMGGAGCQSGFGKGVLGRSTPLRESYSGVEALDCGTVHWQRQPNRHQRRAMAKGTCRDLARTTLVLVSELITYFPSWIRDDAA